MVEFRAFYGNIKISRKGCMELMNLMFKKQIYPFNLIDMEDIEFDISNKRMYFDSNFKESEDEIEKLCLFIATIDNEAKGEIICENEEDNKIKLEISEGKVRVMTGEIVYRDEGYFDNDQIKRYIKKISDSEEFVNELTIDLESIN